MSTSNGFVWLHGHDVRREATLQTRRQVTKASSICVGHVRTFMRHCRKKARINVNNTLIRSCFSRGGYSDKNILPGMTAEQHDAFYEPTQGKRGPERDSQIACTCGNEAACFMICSFLSSTPPTPIEECSDKLWQPRFIIHNLRHQNL